LDSQRGEKELTGEKQRQPTVRKNIKEKSIQKYGEEVPPFIFSVLVSWRGGGKLL
jgi:hypothetical protein